jgi:methyl-accepting chemotaxis protein
MEDQVLTNLSIRTRLIGVLAGVAIVSVGVVALLADRAGVSTLEDQSFDRLVAVRELKADQVEDYFEVIADQVITFAQDRMIVDAMEAFSDAFSRFEAELDLSDSEWEGRDLALREYYQTEFLSRLNANLLEPTTIGPYWPADRAARALQHEFISGSPFDTGAKQLLDGVAGTTYGATHSFYHPILRDFLERFGYYDIFLVDDETGHIVYSVFKEVDFGTSLLSGPYRNTNFSEAFRQNITVWAEQGHYAIVDFEPYDPSYSAQASFIASPIYDGEERIGVLIFQMPVDRLNRIMTSREQWSAVGLGESGETYVVGPDFTVRNQSRFLIEDREAYLSQLADAGIAPATVAAIGNLDTSIGLQPVRTDGSKAAQRGEVGTAIFPDYRDVDVLSAYRPLAIQGLDWVLMSEIDESEAFEAARDLRKRMFVWLVILVGAIVAIAFWFARSLTRPIRDLSNQAERLSSGDLDGALPVERGDEIGDLGRSFETMRGSLAELIRKQDQAIDALAAPLIPVKEDIFVMPLVGEMDERRLAQIRATLVEGLHEQGARAVILDLTGLPELDEAAALGIVRAVRAARLLGVTTVVTGMPADTARQLTDMDVDFDDVQTMRTLEDGIEAAERAATGPASEM